MEKRHTERGAEGGKDFTPVQPAWKRTSGSETLGGR